VNDLGLRRALYYRLSPAWRRRARRIAFAPLDAWSRVRGDRSYNGIPLPLRGEIFTGGGDFLGIGLRFLDHFQTLGRVLPTDDVLEIGSGQGRMAIPLTAFLSAEGSYVGFDVVSSAVEDCKQRVSSRFPRFHFLHVPVRNDLYNDAGQAASALDFPLGDDAFDFAFATSVFSHMEPAEIENYLGETRRVVRPGGRLLATFFLMDDVARQSSKESGFDFAYQEGDAWFMAVKPRSANVAITPESLERIATRAGWSSVDVHPGTWSGRTGPTLDYQDIAVLS
jgi:ubiquinone/menaquinone biosynthesis C-methylase UbiE